MAASPVPLRVTRDNLVPLNVLAPYFILGLASLAVAPLPLWIAASSFTAGAYRHPLLLAAVHTYALGWGTSIALGSLQQLSPVLSGSTLYNPRLAQAAFLSHFAAFLALLAGFSSFQRPAFFVAAVLLPLGIILSVANIILTQRSAPMTRQGLFVRPFMLSAAAYLTGASLAGAALALHLGTGWLGHAWEPVFFTHIAFAAVGWFPMLIFGVSYHMLPFFGLTEKKRTPRFIGSVRFCLHGAVWLFVGRAVTGLPVAPMALLLVSAAAAVFLWQHRDLFHPRGKERMHPIVGYVRAAHGWLAVFVVASVALVLRAGVLAFQAAAPDSHSPQLLPPGAVVFLGFLVAGGWLTNTVLGYLHRIWPFIVWHNKYWGRGREPGVPAFRVMVNGRVAWIGLAVYNAGVLGVLLSLVSPLPVKGALALVVIGGIIAAGNLLRVITR